LPRAEPVTAFRRPLYISLASPNLPQQSFAYRVSIFHLSTYPHPSLVDHYIVLWSNDTTGFNTKALPILS
jgi:hypothetical protein